MARTVVIAQVCACGGMDQVVVMGTVDGTAVTAVGAQSAMTGMTAAQKRAYCASLLAAAAPPVTTDLGITGTVTL